MSRACFVMISAFLLTVFAAAGWSAAVYAPLHAMQVASPVDPARQAPPSEPPRRLIKAVDAEYPAEALENQIGGTVVLILTVDALGNVKDASHYGGPKELWLSAKAAAMASKYEPAPSTTSVIFAVDYQPGGASGQTRALELVAPVRQWTRMSSQGRDQGISGSTLVGSIRSPRKIKSVFPVYPERAREQEIEGNLLVEVRVDTSGKVIDAYVLTPNQELEEAALAAARQWQFEPTTINGVPVPVTLVDWVGFHLQAIQLTLTLPNGTIAGVYADLNRDVNFIDLPGVGYLGFGAAQTEGSASVKVDIFELRNGKPRRIETLELSSGGGIVHTATQPTFGIQLN